MSIVSLIVRLVDQFSGPGSKVANVGDKVAASLGGVAKAGGASGNRWNGLATRIVGVATGVAGLGLVAAKAGKSISGSMRGYAEFEDMLAGIGRTGEMSTSQLASMQSTILKLAPQLGRMPDQVGEVAEKLIAAGITPDRVEKMLAPIGRVAVATRSEIGDITKAAQAMFQNLGIEPDKMESAFDKVWLAAKRGNFELKDMAQFFPKLAAAASSRGMSGVNAAVELASAAQIVMEGSGTPGQAATNLRSLIMKSTAPQTVKKFQKVGIDIKKEIAAGLAKGQSPLETVVLQARKALAKNKSLTVGDLFQDQQSQLALIKLIEKYDEFIKIREEAKRADGTIAADFAGMDQTTLAKMKQLEAAEDVRRKKWAAVSSPWERWKVDKLKIFNEWLGNFTDRFPTLSGGIGVVSTALSDMIKAAGGLGSSLLGIASTLVIGKFLGIGKVLGGIGRTVWALLRPIRFVFGLLGGMIAEAAVILGPALLRGLMALGPFIRRGLMTLFRIFTGPVGWALLAADLAWTFREPLMKAFSGVWDSIKKAFSLSKSEAINTLGAADDGAALEEGGRAVMTKFWEGLKSAAAPLLEWASGFIGQLKSLFSFNASPSITLPKGMPAPWLSPSSYKGGDGNNLTPAPALQRQANVTYHNTFSISGSDNPEAVAQRIVTALNRQRQSGLYDGALA